MIDIVRNGAVSGVVTDRGTIRTPLAINCAGAWAPKIARMAGVQLPIRPGLLQMVAFNPHHRVNAAPPEDSPSGVSNAGRTMARLNRRRKTAPAAGRSRARRAAAAASSTDLLDLFTRTTDGVMAVDPACRVILWNSAAESVLGYPAAEVLGRACHDVVRGRDAAGNLFCHPHCSVLTMARRGEMAHAYDITTQAKDGAERRLNVSTVLVPGAGGNIVVHLFRDVTAAHRARTAEAVSDGRGDGAPPSSPPPELSCPLTAREREILCLMARGEGTQAMARRLFISTATVRNHTQNILTKLAAHSRLEAVALAFRNGII